MYIASEGYKTASKKICRIPKSKVIINGIEYTGIEHIKSHPQITHNSAKMIGEFTTKECKFSLFNRNSDLDLVGKEIEVYRGLVVEGNIIEYIPQGVFKVELDSIKTNSTSRSIELSIKDKSTIFDCPYGGLGNIQYPCTLGEFVNEIITRHGLVLETPNFPFSNFILEQQPNFDINSTSERQLIAQAGELGGCKTQMSRTGGVKISRPYSTEININKTDYKKLPSKEKQFGIINSVILSRKNQTNNDIVFRDENSILNNGLCEWKIYDNPYVDLIREEVIEDVAANIIGMSIIPFELNDVIDNYCYDINDVINITDKEGNVFSSTILSIKSKNRIFADFGAPVQTESKTNYNLAGSSKKQIEKIASDVDYNNLRISQIIQNEDQTNKIISTLEGTTQIITNRINNLSKEVKGRSSVRIEEYQDLGKLIIKGQVSLLYGNNGTEEGIIPFLEPLYPSSQLFGKNMNMLATYEDNTVVVIPLPFGFLNYISDTICDKFVYENGETYVERKVGVNSQRELYALSTPIKEAIQWEKPNIPTGTFTLSLQCFDNVTIQAEYIPKNAYTESFATKVELGTAITQTAEQIDLKVSKNDVINQINLSSEGATITASKIGLEGIVTANQNFKVLLDGSIEAKNGKFTGEVTATSGSFTGSLKLGQTEILSQTNGLLTNLQFVSDGQYENYSWLGFKVYYGDGGEDYSYSDVSLEVNIPNNFTIISAYLTLYHTPVYWNDYDGDHWGYSRNLAIYKTNQNNSNYSFYMTYGGEYMTVLNTSNLTKIENLGAITNTSGSTVQSLTSSNIKNSLATGRNKIIVRTMEQVPNNTTTASQKTGMARAVLNIIGYMKY